MQMIMKVPSERRPGKMVQVFTAAGYMNAILVALARGDAGMPLMVPLHVLEEGLASRLSALGYSDDERRSQ